MNRSFGWARSSSWMLLVSYLSACSGAGKPSTTPIQTVGETAQSDQNRAPSLSTPERKNKDYAFIWRAESNENPDKYFFLLGSVHVAKADFYPLDPVIEEAFESCDALVVEVDLSSIPEKKALNIVMEKAILPKGETLESRLTTETWGKVQRALKELSIPVQMVHRLKPWFAAVTIVAMRIEREGYTPEFGIDQYFMKKRTKEIIELESAQSQLALFDDLEPDVEELLVIDAIEGSLQSGGNLAEVMETWQRGDAPRLEKLMFNGRATSPEFEPIVERLFTNRNKAMADRVEEFLVNRNKLFVVVGAGHLVGDQGLVEIFKRRGYTLTQLERKDDSSSSNIGNVN